MAVLLALARRMGINLSALGIGVDFLQVVSMFSSFGFKWPKELTGIFNAASTSNFNEQLMAPECSITAWNFQLKWCVFVFAAPPPLPSLLLSVSTLTTLLLALSQPI